MIARLTDLARRYLLETSPLVGAEALRLLDAHAADRAALVAQLEELKNQLSVAQAQVKALHTLATEVPDEPTH